MDDIAVQRGHLVLGIREGAVAVVLLGRQCKWHIVLAGRQAKLVFSRVMQDVEAGLAKVSILSSVVDSMVVIPESTGALVVGVVYARLAANSMPRT